MLKICESNVCTGCGLCAAQCPKTSIRMVIKDGIGHLYPEIDQITCIDCGLCQKNCPAIHQPVKLFPERAYAAWAKDENEYKSSTSGGVASILSHYILEQGGVVYGCAMLANLVVRHIRIDKQEDLWKLKGSKYVQSSIVDIIPQIKDDINGGRNTLFVGTPCQVGAIKKLFKHQPDNLYLLDLICHGTPSVNLLWNYLNDKCKKQHFDNVKFRDENGKYCLKAISQGKAVYQEKLDRQHYEGWFISTFFEGYTYRESCYNCQYARPERASDITIGDFWGLGKKDPSIKIPQRKYGCSVILPITTKGNLIVQAVSDRMNIYERPVEEAIEGNSQLNAPVQMNKRIRRFRALYPKFGRSAYKLTLADRIIKDNIKIIIKKLIG